MKNCEHCNTPFLPRPNGRKQRFCKPSCCHEAYTERHPNIGYTHMLKREFNLTLDDYNKLIEDQLGKCLICGRDDRRLVIDHDHKTGKARGLLCKSCNGGLGVYEKYKIALQEYLEPTA